MKKRWLSVVLSLLLLTAMTTANVWASDDGDAAAVGETTYGTLQEAVNEADGQVIKLLRPVTESVTVAKGDTVILDLNGKTLTNQAGSHTITNNGTLTIQGEGTVDNVSHARGAVVNYGTLTITGGDFTRSKEAGVQGSANGNSWYVIDNQGTMTVTGGVIQSTSGFSSLLRNLNATLNVKGGRLISNFITVKNDDNGKLNITGGEIKSQAAGGSAVQNWGEAQISGGTITAENGAASIYALAWDPQYTSDLLISDGAKIDGTVLVEQNGGTGIPSLTMEGGVLNGDIQARVNSDVKIQGGSVSGTITADETADLVLSGGSYAKKPDSKYITGTSIGLSKAGEASVTYYIGTQEEMERKISETVSGDSVVVVSGNVDADITADGVTVTNEGDGSVVINGQDVEKDGEEIVTHTHKLQKVEAKAPTCTEEGNRAYWYCEGCGKYFGDENAVNEIAKDSVMIQAAGHDWEDEFTVDKEATATEEGSKSIHCKNCDEVKDVTAIPVTGTTQPDGGKDDTGSDSGKLPPQTGSNTVVPFVGVIAILSGGALAAVILRRRRLEK